MRILFISIFMLVAGGLSALDMTMREVFRQMPDSLLPYLSENNRLDFIDFMDSKMNAEVSNALGGKSRMVKLTDTYTAISLNEASTLEMCLLPVSEPVDSASHIVCLVYTYGKESRESTVSFYSLRWRALQSSDYITWPEAGMYEARLDDNVLRLTLVPATLLDMPADEEQKTIEKHLIFLKWEGRYINAS